MGRKKVEINPIRGERLKMLLNENGVDQKELADKIGYTKEHISYIINGRRNLTEDAAKLIVRHFPGTRIEWLMGYDDFLTNYEKTWKPFMNELKKMQDKSTGRTVGLVHFLSGSDYKIICNNEKSALSIEEMFEKQKNTAILKHGDQEVYLSLYDLSDLENEISEYIELRLKYLLEEKRRDQKKWLISKNAGTNPEN